METNVQGLIVSLSAYSKVLPIAGHEYLASAIYDHNLKLLDAKLMVTSDCWLIPKDAEKLLMSQPSIKLVL
jgi:hypothetical protein